MREHVQRNRHSVRGDGFRKHGARQLDMGEAGALLSGTAGHVPRVVGQHRADRTDADLHGLPSFPARPHARRRDRGRRRVCDPLRLHGRRAVPIALHERPLSGAADRAVQGANGLLGRALRRRYGLGRPVRTGLCRSADRRLVGRQSRGYGRPGPDAGRRDGRRGLQPQRLLPGRRAAHSLLSGRGSNGRIRILARLPDGLPDRQQGRAQMLRPGPSRRRCGTALPRREPARRQADGLSRRLAVPTDRFRAPTGNRIPFLVPAHREPGSGYRRPATGRLRDRPSQDVLAAERTDRRTRRRAGDRSVARVPVERHIYPLRGRLGAVRRLCGRDRADRHPPDDPQRGPGNRPVVAPLFRPGLFRRSRPSE